MRLVILESPYAARPWSSLTPDERFAFVEQTRAGLGYRMPAWQYEVAWEQHDRRENVAYARECLRHSVDLGEAPIASHLLYPQILDDDKPNERNLGIACGLAWRAIAHGAVFYVDRGWSPGMLAALDIYKEEGIPSEERRIR